ncbi:hypothetical protein [Aeromicrobium fastidiosum]|uniref:Uncharacterized protein n=1 Tax=Aeromicrobium fastidiosum TaxID=52699 RepID=A0A641APB6_9ACTN|nr:hypothetical protein [Aeromicrobium fastidiosum]KAA1378571.1 hypothetical protein ESP62_009515 [Aeromicrobium fastidiosum]MBP2392454.1 hypothetical protein [Aeromicrobium fastidiosum]
MTQNNEYEPLERLLQLPPGEERERALNALPEIDRADAVRALAVADLLWEDAHGAPALRDDPIAAALGLVPDAGYQMDSTALKRARAKAGQKPTTLAAALVREGWNVTAGDVFGWETRTAANVPPALVRAVAEILRTDPDLLAGASHGRDEGRGVGDIAVSTAATVASSSAFQGLVERFARAQGMTVRMAASALESRMLVTVHRGDQPNAEQMLASVEALVEALESD